MLGHLKTLRLPSCTAPKSENHIACHSFIKTNSLYFDVGLSNEASNMILAHMASKDKEAPRKPHSAPTKYSKFQITTKIPCRCKVLPSFVLS